MKKLATILCVLLVTTISANNKIFAKTNPSHKSSFKHKARKHDGAPLLFWTSNRSYGPIEIFVNDVYQGDITSSYASVPECAAEGCVTVIINGDNNVWTAQTKDGKHKWASKRVMLEAKDCNSERLL